MLLPDTHVFDVVIVGAGPAGISCALECYENQLDVMVFDRNARAGGQLSDIPSPIKNYSAGFFENGEQARDSLESIALSVLGDRLKTNCAVEKLDLEQKRIFTSEGVFTARCIFLSTGYRVKRWDLEIPSPLRNDVLYRSGIHKEELKGKTVAIIGSGDSAAFTALELSECCKSVSLIVRGGKLKAIPQSVAKLEKLSNVEICYRSVVKALIGDESLSAIIVETEKNERRVNCDKVIAKLGYSPNTELFVDQLNCVNGHVEVDQFFSTSIEGVYAGGDIAYPGYDRVAFAAGSGVMAARAIRKYIGHNL